MRPRPPPQSEVKLPNSSRFPKQKDEKYLPLSFCPGLQLHQHYFRSPVGFLQVNKPRAAPPHPPVFTRYTNSAEAKPAGVPAREAGGAPREAPSGGGPEAGVLQAPAGRGAGRLPGRPAELGAVAVNAEAAGDAGGSPCSRRRAATRAALGPETGGGDAPPAGPARAADPSPAPARPPRPRPRHRLRAPRPGLSVPGRTVSAGGDLPCLRTRRRARVGSRGEGPPPGRGPRGASEATHLRPAAARGG